MTNWQVWQKTADFIEIHDQKESRFNSVVRTNSCWWRKFGWQYNHLLSYDEQLKLYESSYTFMFLARFRLWYSLWCIVFTHSQYQIGLEKPSNWVRNKMNTGIITGMMKFVVMHQRRNHICSINRFTGTFTWHLKRNRKNSKNISNFSAQIQKYRPASGTPWRRDAN